MTPRPAPASCMLAKLNRLRPLITKEWPVLAVVVALTTANAALTALTPLPIKLVVDSAAAGAPLPGPLRSLWLLAGLEPSPASIVIASAAASLLLFVLTHACEAGVTWFWAMAGQRTVHTLSASIFGRLLTRSPRYHQVHGVGDSLSRLSGDTWCLYSVTNHLLSPLEQIVTILSIGVTAWYLNPTLGLLAFITAPPLALASALFGERLKQKQQWTREAESRMLSFVHQTLASIPVVQAFTTEDRNVARFMTLASERAGLVQRRSLLTGAYGGVTGVLSTLGAAVVLYVGGRQVLAGTLSAGGLIVFFAYLQQLQKSVEGLIGTYGAIKPLEASLERVVEVLDPDAAEVSNRPGAGPVPAGRVRGELRFEAVTVGYEPGQPVLHAVDLHIAPGETIGLVGATGAGKSTLLSLVPRFIDPWSGLVRLDGMDLRDLDVASLRSQVGIVMQESLLFPTTIADNIGYGRPGATRDEIVAAAVAANADAFIRRLPDGYDSEVAERASSLSGGERQRIALARAFLRNAPILLLDEPTSALDPLTEGAILEALDRLIAGRTTLIIAHRLSTIRRADRIVVLEQGRIVEVGSHDVLVRQSGRYQQLHAQQCQPASETRA